LRLRPGTELLGAYEGSAFEQPTYLVRRADGQVIHLSHLLYQVAGLLDGERDLKGIADHLSSQLGRQVVAPNVEYLIETKLRPLGLIATGTTEDVQTLTRSAPLLALRYRKRVIPARLHRGVTTVLQPLFLPPIVLAVVGALVAVNVWMFGTHRAELARAVRQLPYHPDQLLLVSVLVLFSGFFHEFGHATATRYGGGTPGAMGVGIYLAWPAFYTDLTDAYRLNRGGRLRCDLGGVYFNAVLIVAAGAVYLTTGFAPLLVFMVVSQGMAIYQFLPFLRLDGYYIVSDLVGVPNLFEYLGPVLRSMFRRPDALTVARLNRLNRRARRVIKIWSVVTIAFLAFNFGGMAVLAPILIPAEWAAMHLQVRGMVTAFAGAQVAVGVNDLLNLVFVAIAPIGMLLIAGILLRRAVRAIKKWWPTHPKIAAAFAAVLAGTLLFQGQALISHFEASPASPVTTSRGAHPGAPLLEVPRLAAFPSGVLPSAARLVASPPAPDRFYVVQPDDTLWSIATKELGSGEQWPSIFDLNVGRPQPDGRALVNPDLIYPGWRLELPGSEPPASVVETPSPQEGATDIAVEAVDIVPIEPPSAPSVSAAPSSGPTAQWAGGDVQSSVEDASSGGGPAGGTTGGETEPTSPSPASPVAVQPTRPTTRTACPPGSTGCALRRDRPGGPQALPPTPPGSPPRMPPAAPASGANPSGRPQQPAGGQAGQGVATSSAAVGVPDERSPPSEDSGSGSSGTGGPTVGPTAALGPGSG